MTSHVVARAGLLAVLLVSACGQQAATPGGPPPPTSPSDVARPDLVPDDARGPFEATGSVLQDAGHGPQLCVGGSTASYPPQCGGPDVLGFDFAAVPVGSYDAVGDSRYGSFVVTGVPEGDAIRLTEPARPAGPDEAPSAPQPSFATPCPQPADGWRPLDAARTTDETLQAASVRAAAVPGYGVLWIDQPALTPEDIVAENVNDPLRLVLNVSTTGDLAAMESAVREVWGGALCVSRAARSEAELTSARDRLDEPDARLPLLDLQLDQLAGQVTATALLAREGDQRRLDAEFGVGVVRLSSVLRRPAGGSGGS